MTAHPMHRAGDEQVKEYLRTVEAATRKVVDPAALRQLKELREHELLFINIQFERLNLNGHGPELDGRNG